MLEDKEDTSNSGGSLNPPELLQDIEVSVPIGDLVVPIPKEGTDKSHLTETAIVYDGPFGKPIEVVLAEKTPYEMKGHGDKAHAVRIYAASKAADILEKRLAGWTLRQIASEYHVSSGIIHKIIVREVEKSQKKAAESADQIRFIMDERLEFMWKSIYPAISKGNARSVEMGLRIMERQAKIHGIDAPEKKQIDLSFDLSDAEIVAQAKRVGIKDIPSELLALIDNDITDAEYISHDTSNTTTKQENKEEKADPKVQEGEVKKD